jgi:hypothetical protein
VKPANAFTYSIAVLKRHLDLFDSINNEMIDFENGIREASDK